MRKQIVVVTGCKDHKICEHDKEEILNLIRFKQEYVKENNWDESAIDVTDVWTTLPED